MVVRVRTAELAAELGSELRGRGFFVLERGRNECEVRLLNPVSERYDRAKVREALSEWEAAHPGALLDAFDER